MHASLVSSKFGLSVIKAATTLAQDSSTMLLALTLALRPLGPLQPARPATLAHRRAGPLIAQATTEAMSGVIDELLAAEEAALISLMGQRLDVLTDPQFMALIESRRDAAGSSVEEKALSDLAGAVCDFLEELVSRVQELGPQLQERESAAAAATASGAAAAPQPVARPQQRKKPPPGPCGPVGQPPPSRVGTLPVWGGGEAPPQLPALPVLAEGEDFEDAALRERRALNRFKLEKLLDAAYVSADALDSRLKAMSRELDEGFFSHLQWEVEQQVAAKNERLLGILEIVVQRACVEAEAGHPEVELLSALLQTRNRELRQEMYQRRLRTAVPVVRSAFATSVRDTQLHLEKEVLAGGRVDLQLLQQLRVIALEMQPHLDATDEAS